MKYKTDYQFEVATRFRNACEAEGKSQKYVALTLNCSESSISHKNKATYSQKYTLGEMYQICKEFKKTKFYELFIKDSELALDDLKTKEDFEKYLDLLISKIISYEQKS